MLEKLCKILSQNILEEQETRDNRFYIGNFVETALLEHLFRYWLENTLGSVGFKNIKREVTYADYKGPGSRQACDLVGKYDERMYWIELKVAYENTGYTKEELVADIDRLSSVKQSDTKIYIAIFVSITKNLPKKLTHIINKVNDLGGCFSHRATSIPSPKHWQGWEKSHIHVLCAEW